MQFTNILINTQELWDIAIAQIKVQIWFGLFSAHMLHVDFSSLELVLPLLGFTITFPIEGTLTLVFITFREEMALRAVLGGTQRQVDY